MPNSLLLEKQTFGFSKSPNLINGEIGEMEETEEMKQIFRDS
jgi:hypothetical protein